MKPDAISQIYRDGRHYDHLFGTPDLFFWNEQAEAAGSPILELGCGTGLISIPLAEAGFEVVGLDLSPSMLTEAGRKSEGRALNTSWIQGDMRSFDLQRLFKLILLPSNNLCHLLSPDDVENCFSCVRRHLGRDGRFVISVFMPDLEILNRPSEKEDILSKYEDPDGRGQIVIAQKSVYEPDSQIRRNTTFRRIPGFPEEIGHLDMKMYFPQELDALLKCNGFRILAKYGDTKKSPFRPGSKLQLIVAASNEDFEA